MKVSKKRHFGHYFSTKNNPPPNASLPNYTTITISEW